LRGSEEFFQSVFRAFAKEFEFLQTAVRPLQKVPKYARIIRRVDSAVHKVKNLQRRKCNMFEEWIHRATRVNVEFFKLFQDNDGGIDMRTRYRPMADTKVFDIRQFCDDLE
jgi:hypothetical protein